MINKPDEATTSHRTVLDGVFARFLDDINTVRLSRHISYKFSIRETIHSGERYLRRGGRRAPSLKAFDPYRRLCFEFSSHFHLSSPFTRLRKKKGKGRGEAECEISIRDSSSAAPPPGSSRMYRHVRNYFGDVLNFSFVVRFEAAALVIYPRACALFTARARTNTASFVSELPSKPVIFDEYGKEISGVAGPYNEGGDFRLTCSVSGGNPTPKVQWLQGDVVLATLSAGEEQPGARALPLVVRNATRAHLAAVYTCTAENTPLAPPQRATVRIDLYLRPLTVEIVSRELPLSVGRVAELWCKSTGARPPATLTWWLGGRQLNSVTKLILPYRRPALGRVPDDTLSYEAGSTLTCIRRCRAVRCTGNGNAAQLPTVGELSRLRPTVSSHVARGIAIISKMMFT
ncbi:Synaptogenesis protein syg-2 [Eumeta japonica]|uniref:Synaptogenesis protein syg-2 n=1 Tax=Eumeta variegata TaxID=151549 RepID=A0A4C1VQV8_EUMVA|nr:Synaptogenesis protein syg-2 [Eumeta japonica]